MLLNFRYYREIFFKHRFFLICAILLWIVDYILVKIEF